MAYDTEVLADSPVGYWRLGESAGTTATDSSTNTNDGTYVGSPTLGATGVITGSNTAVDFDGTDDGVGIPDDSAIQDIFATGGTVEAWVRAPGQGGVTSIASKTNPSNNDGWEFTIDGSDDVQFLIDFSGGTRGIWRTTTALSLNTNHHIVLTYDASSDANDPIIYVDDVSIGISETSTPSGTFVTDVGLDFDIGQSPPTGSRHFDGVIDEVALYTSVLSAARVTAHFDAGTLVEGTIASTLDDVSSAIQGSVEVTGTISETLDNVTSAMSGTFVQIITGTIAVTLEDVSSAVQGAVEVTGTIAEVLDNVTAVMSGTFVQGVTGTIAVTLEDTSAVMSGIVGAVTGTVIVSLEDVSSIISGTFSQVVTGIIAVTLEDVSSSMTGVAPAVVTLTWQDNSNNELEFRIYRRDVPAINFVQVGTVAADATTFAQVLSAGSYEYKVSARNVLGETFSNTASIIIA